MSSSVHIKDVSVSLGGISILESVTTHFEAGKLNALIGPNGAGKTTLLNALLGFTPFDGEIKLSDQRSPVIGYVPQNPELDRTSPVRVLDFLAAGLMKRPVWLGRPEKVMKRIDSVLDEVGIEDRARRCLGTLSGGEFQRVLLAQALLRNPDLLVLDEPETGVDIVGSRLFCSLIEDVHRAKEMTTIIVSHDLGVVADHADRVIGLNRKILFEGPSPEALNQDNLALLFGPHASLYTSSNNHSHNHQDHLEETPS